MADIPFVSENFQRSFRNTFPSQTSTGRDLHVSDVVIPVVDFTPTTATTSLPFELLTAQNPNTTYTSVSSAGVIVDISATAGFYKLYSGVISDASFGFSQLFLEDTSGTQSVQFLRTSAGNVVQKTDFLFIPLDSTLKSNTYAGAGASTFRLDILLTSIADVNGNLIQPSGYDPQ